MEYASNNEEDLEEMEDDPEVIQLLLEEEMEALIEEEELLDMQQELQLRIQAEREEFEKLKVMLF